MASNDASVALRFVLPQLGIVAQGTSAQHFLEFDLPVEHVVRSRQEPRLLLGLTVLERPLELHLVA
jgi:hypothetical protein